MILAALAAPPEGTRIVWSALLVAVAVASAVDLPFLWRKRHRWEFPSGAILTGLLIVMVLSPRTPWYVPACSSAIAIVSKYVFRTRAANIFNPAALALVLAFYAFHTAQSWWGALPNLTPFALIALFASGVFIADRVNKMPLVLMFLAVYFLLFSLAAFVSDPSQVAEIFRAPDLHAALFFAFFILTDPPTSPVKYGDQLICAVIVAAASFAAFEWVGAAYYLLAGVLLGNVWEAWRRYSSSRGRQVERMPSLVG